jgi:hypothetical protein
MVTVLQGSFDELSQIIKTSTEAGLLCWKRIEEKKQIIPVGIECYCYESKINDFTLRTIIQSGSEGLIISKNGKSFVFSSDPESLPGKKVDPKKIYNLILIIANLTEKKESIYHLQQKLISKIEENIFY